MLEIISKWSVKRKSGKGVRVRCIARCMCGDESEYDSTNVTSGNTTKCKDCANKSRSKKHTKHGHNMARTKGSCTKSYYTWQAMKRRCLTDYDSKSEYYKGRGITICNEWIESFESFLLDMGEPPTKSHSIDRIDNNKGYCKDNCRWATALEQANNKSNNVKITVNGTTKNLCQWVEISGVQRKTITGRIKRGWSEHDAVMTDVGQKHNKC